MGTDTHLWTQWREHLHTDWETHSGQRAKPIQTPEQQHTPRLHFHIRLLTCVPWVPTLANGLLVKGQTPQTMHLSLGQERSYTQGWGQAQSGRC